jgi:hypothetical protein
MCKSIPYISCPPANAAPPISVMKQTPLRCITWCGPPLHTLQTTPTQPLLPCNARGLRVPQRAGTVGARKLSKCLGLGSSLSLPSRAPTTRGQARWSTYIPYIPYITILAPHGVTCAASICVTRCTAAPPSSSTLHRCTAAPPLAGESTEAHHHLAQA